MDFMKDGVDIRGAISSLKDGKLGSGGDAHFYDDNQAPSKIRQNLASNKESDKIKGLKWLLANLSKGKDVSEFFPDVVKNVVVKSVEVKKLVYNYLVHYADFDTACRENSLLSINSFQNDLNGSNQLIRGLALRVMTSIRCLDIVQIQMLAVRKCSADSSPYVRRCAATALPKIFSYDKSQLDSLKQLMRKLLADNSPMVLGQAISSFNEICPTSYDTIHPCLRKICHLLADLDEWTQVSGLNMLIRYVRNQFLDPLQHEKDSMEEMKFTPLGVKKAETKRRVVMKKAFYSDDEDESGDEEIVAEMGAEKGSVFAEPDADHNLDPDHKLILRSSTPLLKSRNAGVVVAVCTLHFYCGSRGSQSNVQIGKALVRILRNQREIQYVVLSTIKTMAQAMPSLFISYLPDFFIKAADPVYNRLLKLDILSSIATKQNIELIFRELQVYAKHSNEMFVSAAVRTVGKVADVDLSLCQTCMEGLIYLLSCTKSDKVIEETMNTLRIMIMQCEDGEISIVILKKMIKLLLADEEEAIEVPAARSNIVWLVGENLDSLEDISPDVLRLLAAGFVDEETDAKTQILNLAIKLSLKMPDDENVQNLSTYVLEMARYDVDTDLRDRSRFMTAMMGLAPSNESNEQADVDEDSLAELAEHAPGILLPAKLAPTFNNSIDVEGMPVLTVGSLSALVGHYVNGYEVLQDWPAIQPNPATRDALPEDNNSQFSDRIDEQKRAAEKDTKPFYDEDSDADTRSESGSDSSDSSDSGSDSDSNSESDSDESSEDESSEASSSGEESESASESEESEEEVRKPLPISSRQQGRTMKKVGGSGAKKTVVASQPAAAASGQGSSMPFDLNLLDFTPAPPSQQQMQGGGQSNLMLQQNMQQMQQSSSMGSLDGMNNISAMDSMDGGSSPAPQSQPMQYGLMSQPQQQMQQMPQQQFGMQPQQHMGYMPQQVVGGMNMMQQQPMGSYGMQPQQMMYGGQQQGGMHMQGQQNMQGGMPQQGGQMMMQQQMPPQQMLAQENLSHPVNLFQPELCSGLAITLSFRNGSKPSIYANANCVLISVKSTTDQIRRIKLTIPTEIKRTPALEEIPVLGQGQEHIYSLEMVLQGFEGKKLPIIATCDRGTYNSTFKPEIANLLTPLLVGPDEFLAARSKLNSINEVSRSFETSSLYGGGISGGGDLPSELSSRMNRLINTRRIQTASSSNDQLLFASCFRKGMTEERVLVSIHIKDPSSFTVQLNCDNAAFSNTLMDVFKSKF